MLKMRETLFLILVYYETTLVNEQIINTHPTNDIQSTSDIKLTNIAITKTY